MAKIILIEDHIMLRDMIKENIEGTTKHTVVGVSSDAKDSVELCKSLNPDLVLMDICTENNSSGIIYGGKIKEQFPNIKVKIFPKDVLQAMKKATDEVMEGYAAENADFKEV